MQASRIFFLNNLLIKKMQVKKTNKSLKLTSDT